MLYIIYIERERHTHSGRAGDFELIKFIVKTIKIVNYTRDYFFFALKSFCELEQLRSRGVCFLEYLFEMMFINP